MTRLKNVFLILLSLSLNICTLSSHVKASTSEKDEQSYQIFLKLKEQLGKEFEDKFNQNAKAEKARQKLLRQEEGNTKQQLLEGMSRFLRQTQQACMKGSSLEQLSSMVNQQYQNLQNVYCRNGVVPPNFPKKLTLRTKLVPVPFKNTDTQVQFSRYDIDAIDKIITSEVVPFYASETQIGYSKDNSDFSNHWHRAVELYFQDFSVLESQSSQKEQIAKNFQLCLPQDKLVYKMEFPVQTKPLIFQSYTLEKGRPSEADQWKIIDYKGRCTKGKGSDSTPLIAYGGHYHPEIDLAEINNSFVCISSLFVESDGSRYFMRPPRLTNLFFHCSIKLLFLKRLKIINQNIISLIHYPHQLFYRYLNT